MSGVSKISAREIFDSRGNPTVEVDITTSKGKKVCLLLVLPCFKVFGHHLLNQVTILCPLSAISSFLSAIFF